MDVTQQQPNGAYKSRGQPRGPEAGSLPLTSLALTAEMSRALPEVLSPRNLLSVFQLLSQYNYKLS